jgi:hypothetical protein
MSIGNGVTEGSGAGSSSGAVAVAGMGVSVAGRTGLLDSVTFAVVGAQLVTKSTNRIGIDRSVVMAPL